MKKTVFFCVFCLSLVFFSKNVYASSTIKARIGNKFFDTLEEAIESSSSTDVITLTNSVFLDKTLNINKTVNIDLNGNTISADERVFLIHGGSLNLSGNGKVVETKPNYGAITLKGSDKENDKNYSTVSVSEGITLEGWSGVFITHNNGYGYGVLVNMNGIINAIDDINGSPGAGIYVNGNIKHMGNAPTINLSKSSKITSSGNGIYSAGYSTYNIDGAYISGVESGLGIKSGIFNILDGTIIGTGPDKTPTSGNNNGINASGTAIQMESNAGYAGNIELYIKNGVIKSNNSNAIYEYTTNNTTTKVKKLDISGGNYSSKSGKDIFLLSDSLKNKIPKFISGGTYSSDPTNYLKNGYSISKDDNALYKVISSTMAVFGAGNNIIKKPLSLIMIVSLLAILLIIGYSNRKQILSLFNKNKK